eukprot:TRINITY_DN26944_c0_g1_i1.p2 TRINITY_DN26944_c0_g1~~TRINITY_DN26944_c0_g1_i1.p2  ORF type:complete len:212 (-),score=37.72 TRINITY_DN26944_c0_g1_i1:69-704(-)
MSTVQVTGPCGIIEEFEPNLTANDLRRHFRVFPEGDLIDQNHNSVQDLHSGDPPYTLQANPATVPFIHQRNGVAYADLDFVNLPSQKVSINLQELFRCASYRQVYGKEQQGARASAWKERGQQEATGFREKGKAKPNEWSEGMYALKEAKARPNNYKEEGRAEARRVKEERGQEEGLGAVAADQIVKGAHALKEMVEKGQEKVQEWVEKRK